MSGPKGDNLSQIIAWLDRILKNVCWVDTQLNSNINIHDIATLRFTSLLRMYCVAIENILNKLSLWVKGTVLNKSLWMKETELDRNLTGHLICQTTTITQEFYIYCN